MLDYKNDFKMVLTVVAGFQIMALCIPLSLYLIYSGPYEYALIACLGFASTIVLTYLVLAKDNKITARAWLLTSTFFPELFLIGSIFIFCYGGVIRPEAFLCFLVYLTGIIYWHFIFKDQAYEKFIPKDKVNLESGLPITGWPKFKDLDWFGKLYLYGSCILFVPAILMTLLGQSYTHKPIEVMHKYLMAAGYSFMFMMMAVSASHISFKRAVRVVRKYNLNWD